MVRVGVCCWVGFGGSVGVRGDDVCSWLGLEIMLGFSNITCPVILSGAKR